MCAQAAVRPTAKGHMRIGLAIKLQFVRGFKDRIVSIRRSPAP